MIEPCLLALRTLTLWPAQDRPVRDEDTYGDAALCFPLVGLLIGLILWGAHQMLSGLYPPVIEAVVLLALWQLLTGLRPLAATAMLMPSTPLPTGMVLATLLLLLQGVLILNALTTDAVWLLLVAPAAGRIAALALLPLGTHVTEATPSARMAARTPRGLTLLWAAWLIVGITIGFGLTPALLLILLWSLGLLLAQWRFGGVNQHMLFAMMALMETGFMLVLTPYL